LSTEFSLSEHPDFLSRYKAYNLNFPKLVSKTQLGGRLIPKDIVAQNSTELVKIFRKIVAGGNSVGGTAVGVSLLAGTKEFNSVDPARRKAAFSALLET
jgi:hypothetical protein